MTDHRPTAGLATLGALVAVYAWWAVERPPFSTSATVAVLAAGVVAMTWGALSRRPPRPPVDAKVGWWAALVGALAVWEVLAYMQQPRDEHPTLSSLTNTLLESHVARAAAFVVWLAAARGLARR